MCCLFGMVDYGHSLNSRQKTRILAILSAESEERGIPALLWPTTGSSIMILH